MKKTIYKVEGNKTIFLTLKCAEDYIWDYYQECIYDKHSFCKLCDELISETIIRKETTKIYKEVSYV